MSKYYFHDYLLEYKFCCQRIRKMTRIEDISMEEMAAIEELKRRVDKDLTPKLREDETLYYRFLKARDFNVQNAEDMLRKHIEWRKEYQMDTILMDYKPPEVLIKYFTMNFLGFDKEGFPVRYVDLAADHKGLISSVKKVDLIKYNLYLVEQDMETLKKQSKKLGKPLTKVMYIHNYEKITLGLATNKAVLELLLLAVKMYQDNYPERIKSIYIINASIYFSMIFTFVKSFIAPAVLAKLHIFGQDKWSDAFLQLIDANVLPAFLGGNRTDPDGNPLCLSFMVHPKIIPESYYLQKSEKKLSLCPDVKKVTVTRFSKEIISFDVQKANSLLEWEFETKNRDIAFGVYFKEDLHENSKPIEVIPKQRLDTYYDTETGTYKCEKTGTYFAIFDNSYSWFFPKEIYYRMRVKKNCNMHIRYSILNYSKNLWKTMDLTDIQKNAISELRKRFKNEVSEEVYEDTHMFYKFLKARNFNLRQAESMLRKNLAFRKKLQLDTIITDYKVLEVCEKYISHNFLGYDKEGSPVYLSATGNLDCKGVFKSANKLEILKFLLQFHEVMLQQLKLQTKKLGKPIVQCVYIYDMDKFTLAKATDKSSIQQFVLGVGLIQDNYPELLKALYVINASAYFTIVFPLVKAVLANSIIGKMTIFGRDGWKEELLKTIDADVLPACLGGTRTDPDGNPQCNTFVNNRIYLISYSILNPTKFL
ncbi:hypothetical protein CDAR_369261 [Caerostris darwini]|uniref:SEC14-like protein 2 n=1 Tax=Caerostris darwini TaxID=1538125 RepID=A0AAV4QS46_9ARAC|nr:hypothetical protein CDAR_369261 [Caerostris darwini]